MEGVSPAGKTDPLIVREVFVEKLGRVPSADDTRAVCESYLRYLPEEVKNGSGYRVMAGVRETLRALAAREEMVLGLGTGNLERGARIKLAPAGLNDYFPFGGFGSDAEARPEVLRAGVRRAEARSGERFSPRDVFVIGDTLLDVEAGKAIGATTVAVAAGHAGLEDLRAGNPDILLESLAAERFWEGLPR